MRMYVWRFCYHTEQSCLKMKTKKRVKEPRYNKKDQVLLTFIEPLDQTVPEDFILFFFFFFCYINQWNLFAVFFFLMQFELSLLPPAAKTAPIPDLTKKQPRDTCKSFWAWCSFTTLSQEKSTFENTIRMINKMSGDSRLKVTLIKCSKRRIGMGQS